ncbi:hypothetical protein P175DRAFT_0516413 [Aspergillus ochraceoroseus IBT 24754]|uniref:N-alpha-acetyltransferase 40 n=1 Tax=Aspergillus ochraceoroseus IBT 24754 TaxID=1392256 RepID=A0A2T5LX01_9EURO|nr:uncharacterized protein P175DRAFT_0516413 [Aspergillus ochraceoroseus IBT 24754]PTU20773.1 hypothetical protein P175DRAFT_0516413 [Aspergillus ochraceoroseus IBT 24754]
MPPLRRVNRKDRVGKNTVVKKQHSINKPTGVSTSPDKPLPLVERTNKLSLEEFLSLYVPSSELRFRRGNQRSNSRPPSVNTSYNSTGQEEEKEYTLEIHTAGTIPAVDLEECYKLIELTSSSAYKSSSIGWSPSEKKKEMKLPDMKYMILRQASAPASRDAVQGDSSSSPVGGFLGFLEFMITYEDGKEVAYCYEIHLLPKAQRQRLGEELMMRFERVGQRIGLEKAMLTVFKSNTQAANFYGRVGYEEDENSPRPRRLRNGMVKEADYRIMSKSLQQRVLHCTGGSLIR